MQSVASNPRRRLVAKGAVSAGFVALAAALLLAHGTPASGYEISVYDGTPVGFWIGIALALLVTVIVSLLPGAGRARVAAVLLGGGAIVSVAALPLIRGYYYYGEPDSLTHLGWTREIAAGELNPAALFYPGIHTLSVFVSDLTGFALPRAIMLVVLLFVVVYLVFVTLTVRLLASGSTALAVGALSAFMLLPINNVVTELNAHPISQATLFLPLVLFLLVKYLTAERRRAGLLGTGVGAMLALSTTAVLLYHPQEAVIVLLLFAAVAAVQFIYRRRPSDARIGAHRPVYTQTVFLAVLFLVWTFSHENLSSQIELITTTVIGFVVGGGGEVAGVVAQRGGSLQAVGSGLFEIFVKLFLVSAVYATLAGLLMAASLLAGFDREYPDSGAVVKYFAVGFVGLVALAALHLVGQLSKLFFRYAAAMMVIVTLVGALAIVYYAGDRDWGLGGAQRVALGAGLAIMLAMSVVTLYPSPYTFLPSVHMTEQQFDGYETSFELTDDPAAIASVGIGTWRYQGAVQGPTGVDRPLTPDVPPEYSHDLVGYLSDAAGGPPQYLLVSEFARTTEVDVYRGLRYDDGDFRALQRQPGVDLVQTNGEVSLYLADDRDAD